MSEYLVPGLLAAGCVVALRKRENAYDLLLNGAADGLKLLITLIPTLILLLTAVTMLRASGAMEQISRFLSPIFSCFGIPPECAMLVLIRPFSGSAALAIGAELMAGRPPLCWGRQKPPFMLYPFILVLREFERPATPSRQR